MLIAAYEEVMAKGSHVNTAIRHYFGLNIFVDYTSADPLGLISYEDEVAVCDYNEVTPKVFF